MIDTAGVRETARILPPGRYDGEDVARVVRVTIALCDEVDRLRERNALDEAADEIATLCGCAHWDYPGQLVQDVRRLCAERDVLRAQRDTARADADDAMRQVVALQARVDAGLAECDRQERLTWADMAADYPSSWSGCANAAGAAVRKALEGEP